MAFQKFDETGKSYKPIVSIRTNGTIGLSAASLTKFLRDVDSVTLYFDSDAQMIGIKPSSKDDSGAHKVHRGKTGGWIGASRFLDFINITSAKTSRHIATWDADHEMVVFSTKSQPK